MRTSFKYLLFAISLFCFTLINASDLERENRIYSEIVDNIFDGESIWFDDEGHKYLGIYTKTETVLPTGQILILHGRGLHANWQDVINPLRIGLTEHGWDTLSLQLPVLAKAAQYYDYVPTFLAASRRIQTAVKYLSKRNPGGKLVIIAHSCGFHMANNWLGRNDTAGIDAFVGIGMGATDTGQNMVENFNFAKLAAPILDIYGENDFSSVLGSALTRKIMLEFFANEKSLQYQVPGVGHYFVDRGNKLVEIISKWLDDVLDKNKKILD